MEIFRSPERAAVVELLEQAGLPVADVSAAMLEGFLGCGRPDALHGAIGGYAQANCGA
jgi:hypothetical protein